MIDSLDTLPLSPTSHSIDTCLRAWLARHQLSATTATQSSPRTTFFTPRMDLTLESSKLLTLPPNTGHCAMDACTQPGQTHVGRVDLLAGGLVGNVEAGRRGADELPLARVLELGLFRNLELRSGRSDLAESRAAIARRVRNHAFGHAALGGGHAPLLARPLRPASRARRRHPCARIPASRGFRGCRRWTWSRRCGCAARARSRRRIPRGPCSSRIPALRRPASPGR